MVQENVKSHEITLFRGIIGCDDYKLTMPEIFTMNCEGPQDFQDEGIVNNSKLLCRWNWEHKDNAINVYRKEIDGSMCYHLSRQPLKDWEVIGYVVFAMNFYE